ncbi:hypothetical protein QBC37DRAFT_384229 [Rhypophila decipiens]|uniref:Acyltransferase 3 domain-containing protein n=1 Tax=Rhypophila decipiens TaxID=261697 RepID=A0AAN6YE33_9PEZI|nr:hypothetical protein QBC37DRAFT_384229 [Rhypophila decipiens]
MPRFLSILGRAGSGYLPLTNRTPSPSSDSSDGIESEKTLATWGRRWSSVRQFTSISGILSLLLLLLATVLRFLLPSFAPPLFRRLQSLLSLSRSTTSTVGTLSSSNKTQPRRLSPTAYLDGLRGMAALVVYLFHFSYLWFPQLGTGYTGNPPNDYFLQRPIIRSFHNGRSSVTTFFIISGFVLPLKTLSEMHKYLSSPTGTPGQNNNNNNVLNTLAGSLIRRPLRLYPPIIAITALAGILVRIPRFYVVNKPPRFGTWQEQLNDWYTREFLKTMDLFAAMRIFARTGLNFWPHDYNGALWSMTVEFKGSVTVFVFVLMLAGFGRTKRWAGLGIIFAVGVWLVKMGDFDMGLFFAGLLFAEFHVRRRISSAGGGDGRSWLRMGNGMWHFITIAVLVVGLHFMGYPEHGGEKTWGFRSMTESDVVPYYYWPVERNEGKDVDTTLMQQFWISVGSILFLWAIMCSPPVRPGWWSDLLRLRFGTSSGSTTEGRTAELAAVPENDSETEEEPLLQKPFTTDFAQYMGKISYIFYLCHLGVQNSICLRYLSHAGGPWKKAGDEAAALAKQGPLEESAAALAGAKRAWVLSFMWTLLVNSVALFWVADLMHRLVDVNTVRMTRKVSTWISK